MENILFEVITPYREVYKVTKEGFISHSNTFSGNWKMIGLSNVKSNEFIPFNEITPERIKELQLRYKNGNPRYTVRDLDHGTTREWGNTQVHGVKNIIFVNR